jgi:uncharacterized phage protein (TIGR02220 family)
MHPWTPIPKVIQREILLNTPRPYPKAVAYLSVSLDCDENRPVSVAGYAAAWGWHRNKVRRFLDGIGAAIQYPESTSLRQNQRGQIVVQMMDRSMAKMGQITLLNFNNLQAETDRSNDKGGQIKDRSQVTTIDTDTKTKNIPFSEIVSYLNDRAGKSFRPGTKTTRSHIAARWHEGFALDDFQKVIDSRCAVWKDNPEMAEYLRPETLFGPKFEGYLNAASEKRGEGKQPEQSSEEIIRRHEAGEAIARGYRL